MTNRLELQSNFTQGAANPLASFAAPVLLALAFVASAQAGADASRGQQLYESRCIGCHSIDHHRVGPAHRGVFGRRAGTASGYDYSEALRESGKIWTQRNLDLWLTNPEKFIPGQKMGYSLSDAMERADVIAYLKSQ